MTPRTPKMPQDSTSHEDLLEAARLIGDLLREERRADDRSLANEFAASEREFERWFNSDESHERLSR